MNYRRKLVTRSVPAGRRDRESGQALVIFVGALTTILVAIGLVIDGGVAFFNRRDAQNTADLTSLAGTKIVSEHYIDTGRRGADVYDAIDATSRANACAHSGRVPCDWDAFYIRPGSTGGTQVLGPVHRAGGIPGNAQGVRVIIESNPGTYFLGVVGQATWDVRANATSLTARSTGLPAGGVLPIAVDPPNNNFQPGSVYQLTAGKDAPGNFSWLSWTGTNDSGSLANSICNPDNPEIAFPAWLTGDPGKTNSVSVRRCVDKWIQNGETVLIPTWSAVREQGNNVEYQIWGLAAFVLLDAGQPAIDTLTARFVHYYGLPTISKNWGPPPCRPGSDGCGDQTVFIGLTE